MNPAALRIPSSDFDIFIVRDFLDRKQCARLIRLIDQGSLPSQVLAPTEDPEYRTSESCNLDPADAIVGKVEARLTELLDIAPPLGETIQGQRYSVGQQFKAHFDFFHVDQAYWPEMERTGGQRTWTAMAFLNEPESGGETFFPTAGVKITPRTGNLLVWNNLDAAGEPNLFSLHQGMPVTGGVKYVITKWHRERPWSSSNVPTY
jgi:prolyl 4-hydroxylase